MSSNTWGPSTYPQVPGDYSVIESPQGAIARRTDNVTRWRDADMVQLWVADS
jgi:hypothetical protein